MPCAPKTRAGFSWPVEFIVTSFSLLFLSFIFHLDGSNFFPLTLALFSQIPSLFSRKVPLCQPPIPCCPCPALACVGAAWSPPMIRAPLPAHGSRLSQVPFLLRSEGIHCHLHFFTFLREDPSREWVRFCPFKSRASSLIDNRAYLCKQIMQVNISHRNFICCVHRVKRTESPLMSDCVLSFLELAHPIT